MLELPDYNALLQKGPYSRPIAKKILGLLLKSGKELHVFEEENLKKLFPGKPKDEIEDKKSKVEYNVSLLKKYNFIEGERWGPIRLKYKTPLCWIASTPGIPFAYLGLLGARKYDVSETETAVGLLKEVGINPEKIVVFTSKKAIGEWEGGISSNLEIDWLTLSEEELSDIDKVEEKIKPRIIELMKDYILIMDLTSGPRPAGIAYYELALQFKVPLIYVYEPIKKLRWLISKDKLEKEIGNVFYVEPEEKVEKEVDITKIKKRGIIY